MSTERPQQHTSATSLNQCLDHIRFARATELARSCNYPEAEALLAPNGNNPESSRELDLLARIAAQQERFDDATRYWNAALKNDPGNATYKDCLQQLFHIQTGRQPAGLAPSLLLWCGIAVCALLVMIGMFLSTHRTPTTELSQRLRASSTPALEGRTAQPTAPLTTPTPAATAQIVTPPERSTTTEPPVTAITESASAIYRVEQSLEQMRHTQGDQIQSLTAQMTAIQTNHALLLQGQNNTHALLAELAQTIADLNAHHAATQHAIELTRSELATLAAAHDSPTPTPTNSRGLQLNLSAFTPGITGVTITPQNDFWLICFDPGLFDRDEHFQIGAKARLQSVAKALVQSQARFKVQIIGLAEDEPPTWPWSRPHTSHELGLHRAQKAADYLRSLGIFPPDKLSAAGGAPNQRPFPTPNTNNRTVTLEVSAD